MDTDADRSWGRGERAPGRTLIAGYGKIGARLADVLVADGHEVLAVRRSPGALPAGIRAITQDLTLSAPRDLPACDSVVITLPPGAESGTYAVALENLATALPTRPSRVLFVSSTRVFEGRPGPLPLTERDEPRAIGDRARELLRGEDSASRLFGACIVRPAGIYGPGRDSLVRRVRDHVPLDHSRRTNRIHEDDLVALLGAMLRATDPPALIHAVDRAPALLGEVVAFIAQRLGVEPPPRITPETHGGTVLDGSLMHEFAGALRFPSFREGYARLVTP